MSKNIGAKNGLSSISSQKTELTAPDSSANTSVSYAQRGSLVKGSLSKTILTPTSEVDTKRN